MTWIVSASWVQDFENLAKFFGLPGAMLLMLVILICRGQLLTKREQDHREASYQRDRAEFAERYAKMEKEKDMWRDLAIQSTRLTERAVSAAHKAVGERK